MLRLSQDDHAKVAVAVAEAEANSNGEIVTIATALSDKYHDVALHWAVAVLIAVLAFYAAVPSQLNWVADVVLGGWSDEHSLRELLTILLVIATAKFTVVLLILRWMPLRLLLTPGRDQDAAGAAARDRVVQGRRRAADDRPHRDLALSVGGRASRRDRRRSRRSSK